MMRITAVIVTLALGSSLLVTVIYGSLTSWYRSRTGKGFFSLLVAITILLGITLVDVLMDVPLWVWWIGWSVFIIAVNVGVLWNIVYKQFFTRQSDSTGKSNSHREENSVSLSSEHKH